MDKLRYLGIMFFFVVQSTISSSQENLCIGASSVVLGSSSTYTHCMPFCLDGFIWSTPGGSTDVNESAGPSNSNAQITFNSCGTVIVTVNNLCNPGPAATMAVSVTGPDPDPPTNVSENATLCLGDSISLMATCSESDVEWFIGSCGGTLVGSGSSYNTGPITSTETFYVRCTNTCGESDCEEVTVEVVAQDDPSFVIDNFCEPISNSAYDIVTPGGIFQLNPVVAGVSINSANGFISGAIGGNTYTVKYISGGACPDSSEVIVEVLTSEDASFLLDDFCAPFASPAYGIETSGGIFEFSPSPGGSTTINEVTGLISDGVANSSYTVQYIVDGVCPDTSVVIVDALGPDDPVFLMDDFCVPNSESAYNIASPGGFFKLEPPIAGVTINMNSAEISGAIEGGSYTIEYLSGGTCPDSSKVTVNATEVEDAGFLLDDFCVPSSGAGYNINTIGGTFSFEPSPIGAVTIDANTGIITGVEEESLFQVRYITTGICPDTSTVVVSSIAKDNPNFTLDDFCESVSGPAYNISKPGGIFQFDVSPGGGVSINGNTGVITGGLGGETYDIEYITNGTCIDSLTLSVSAIKIGNPEFSINPVCANVIAEANITGDAGGTFSLINLNINDTSIINNNGELIGGMNDSTYTIKYVTPGSCPDSAINTVQILSDEDASFTSNNFCIGDSNSVNVLGDNGGVFSFNPDPADGATINQDSGWVINPVPGGLYTFQYKTSGSCPDSNTVTVMANPLPEVNFSWLDSCFSNSIQFVNNSAISSGNIALWDWAFGDGSPAASSFEPINFYNLGEYIVELKATSELGCESNMSKIITIHPEPEANFGFSNNCINENGVKFIDSSLISSGEIIDWEWNFNDGSTLNSIANPQHQFNNPGSYDVQLIVTSDMYCFDTILIPTTVLEPPNIEFTVNTLNGCAPLCLDFVITDNSIVPIDFLLWDFDNGSSQSDNLFTYCYSNEGTYNPKLVAYSSNGCSDTARLGSPITVYPQPIADFSVSSIQITLSDASINFFDESVNAENWEWYFGDGSSSSDQNPIHTFGDTGTFQTILRSFTQYGCTDFDTLLLKVGPDFSLFVPNTITLNSDRLNDIFLPKGTGIIRDSYELLIYNRWGEEIFVSDDLDVGWDGKYKSSGKFVKQDVYIYKITLRDVFNKLHVLNGHVTVLK